MRCFMRQKAPRRQRQVQIVIGGNRMFFPPQFFQPGSCRCGIFQPCRCGRTALDRILRNNRQGQNLRQIQPTDRRIKPNLSRGGYPFNISAVGCQIKISFKNFVFGIKYFQLQSPDYLQQFAGHRGRIDMVNNSCHLHGQGRSSLPAAAGQHLPNRTEHTGGINAGMLIKPPVFI